MRLVACPKDVVAVTDTGQQPKSHPEHEIAYRPSMLRVPRGVRNH